ncbi:MAG: type II toxin-antitoxin system HipA family toxin [Vicinamibacterales bacterium]
MIKALSVWWDGRVAGTLKLSNTGGMTFIYSPAWIADRTSPPLSISLPKREQRFTERECRPFFSGLLPEEGQRDAAAAALGLSKHNDFALLDALGGEVAGALTLWPDSTPPPSLVAPASVPLTDRGLDELITALPKRPLLAGGELRLSLAGAQPKVPVVLVDGRIALPAQGQPTSHILKPAIERFAGTTENEALVMKLAAAVGLDVATVEVRSAGSRPFLLVTRYDRTTDDRGLHHRLHQEDFCQAMSIAPVTKYEKEGGPTLARCFELLRRAATRPAVDVLRLVDAVIFNVIAGNADAHGKNFSLLYADDEVRLAPLYDLLCTAGYPELSPRLAMKVGGRAMLDEMGTKTWPAFAEAAGVAAPFVIRRVGALCDAVRAQLPEVTSEFAPPCELDAVQRVAELIGSRASRLAKRTLAG